ncbi:MAG: twin-arginine translocase TatA/TatE family subunit [Pseudobdellovibrionaceae bacterium]
MFNLGFSEMAMIAALALVLIGPKQLPEVARALGRLLNELKRSTSSFTDDLKNQVDLDHRRIMNPEKRDEPSQAQSSGDRDKNNEEKPS